MHTREPKPRTQLLTENWRFTYPKQILEIQVLTFNSRNPTTREQQAQEPPIPQPQSKPQPLPQVCANEPLPASSATVSALCPTSAPYHAIWPWPAASSATPSWTSPSSCFGGACANIMPLRSSLPDELRYYSCEVSNSDIAAARWE